MRSDRSRFPAAPVLRASALALAVLGCAGESPVARLEVSPPTLTLPHGQVRPLTLVWTPVEALEEVEGPPLVFVHLLSEPGRPLRTFDHPFPRDWRPGTPVRYELPLHQSALAPPLPAGGYRLTVGLYQAGGRRWPLAVQGEEIDGREYLAAAVEVPAEAPGPRFGFAGPWLEVEPGEDLQMLARRWLLGDGALGVRDAPGAGALWMTLRIPEGGRAGERLVLEPGAAEPGVVLSGTCSEVETGITGRGTHEVRLPVAAGAPPCEVRFDVNFHLVTEGSPHRRTVALEGLAWAGS